MTLHILGELSRVATHYGIIKNGTIIKEISAEELSRQCEDFIRVRADQIDEVVTLLSKFLKDSKVLKSDDNECKIYGTMDGKGVNQFLIDNGIVVEELSYHRMDLEEYFLKLMGGAAE